MKIFFFIIVVFILPQDYSQSPPLSLASTEGFDTCFYYLPNEIKVKVPLIVTTQRV